MAVFLGVPYGKAMEGSGGRGHKHWGDEEGDGFIWCPCYHHMGKSWIIENQRTSVPSTKDGETLEHEGSSEMQGRADWNPEAKGSSGKDRDTKMTPSVAGS